MSINRRDLIKRLLDSGYKDITSAMTSAIAQENRGGRLDRRLKDLIAEAHRLETAGLKLAPDNAVAQALLLIMETVLADYERIAAQLAADLQTQGIQTASQLFPELNLGANINQLVRIGVRFNMPSVESITSAVNFASSSAFAQELAKLTPEMLEKLQQTIVKGFVTGQGPLTTARQMRSLATGYPQYRLNNLMRTLQLESYRNGTLAIEVANADLFETKIRIAALDDRTCLSCISLHGTELAIGEKVKDHHQGRCIAILVVKGRPRQVTTGNDWFNNLPPDRQRAIAGHANYEALQAGKVTLKDFVGDYQDAVFGEMLRENSLQGILGNQARDYYQTTQ